LSRDCKAFFGRRRGKPNARLYPGRRSVSSMPLPTRDSMALAPAGRRGLQGYGIGGDAEDNLRRSMKAWRQLKTRCAADKQP